MALQLAATNESCTANGSLSFAAVNTAPGAILVYRIFKLPDTITPIAVTSANTFGGLTAGTYRVVAIQTVGNAATSVQQDIAIANQIVPIIFQIQGNQPVNCHDLGSLLILVGQGNAATYEIISGPAIFPPQTSPSFANLVAGQYDIRVNDACGDGDVQTFSILPPSGNLLVAFDEPCNLVDCNTKAFDVHLTTNPGTMIVYPLDIIFTVNPPGQNQIVLSQTLTSGSGFGQNLHYEIPYVDSMPYTVNIKITDPCGHVTAINYSLNTTRSLAAEYKIAKDRCTEGIYMDLCNLTPPYMVHFLEAPADFVPETFNLLGLGPFTTTSISYVSTHTDRLPDGDYVFEVTDACGITLQNSVHVKKDITDHVVSFEFMGCDISYSVNIPFSGIGPATVILTTAPQAYDHELPYDVSFNIDQNNFFAMHLSIPGTYTFTGINICGDPFTRVVVIEPIELELSVSGIMHCNQNGELAVEIPNGPNLASVTIIQAPSTFAFPLPYDASAFISGNQCDINGLPLGSYTVMATDVCGNSYGPIEGIIAPIGAVPPEIEYLRGCGIGFGSVYVKYKDSPFVQMLITAAPASFIGTLPFDVSANIASDGMFYMNGLAEGTYTFHSTNMCHAEQDIIIDIPGNNPILNTVTVISNCGSFNLALYHLVEPPRIQNFWLQRFDPLTGQWGHPYTGVAYPDSTVPTTVNSLQLGNYVTNYNIAAFGQFRVLKFGQIFSNGDWHLTNCYTVLKEFEFTGELEITASGAVPCSNNTYDVFVIANGVAPITYSITSKDGLPFEVNNGTVNIFTGLTSGIYNFQLQDLCGNIVNRLVDITTLAPPAIAASDLCVGQTAQLSVQPISFLSYQWWNGNNPSAILSTTNTLNFNPFSNSTSPGTYFIRIYSANNLSCIDKTISYDVLPAPSPNAGHDGETTICGLTNSIDLTAFLGTNYDTGGVWTESSNNNAVLPSNNWTPINYGTFTFKYTVLNPCSLTDNANVIIHLNPIPPDPVITVSPNYCSGQTIQLQLDPIASATYQWTGPNGFSSTLQNPIVKSSSELSSGEYTVIATVNGCESTASIPIGVLATPIYTVSQSCRNNVFTATVEASSNSFDPETVSYSWSGPSSFSATTNSVHLTQPGLYHVNVTNIANCSVESSFFVNSTLCSIPNAVTHNDDQINDVFDLSGMDVKRLEIYSRWGRLVYEQNNYTDEWYGQNMHGKELPDSTYYYIIYLNSGQEKQGWVYKMAW